MREEAAELENDALDALDEADDEADAPAGTVALTAARRRRSLEQVLALMANGPPAG